MGRGNDRYDRMINRSSTNQRWMNVPSSCRHHNPSRVFPAAISFFSTHNRQLRFANLQFPTSPGLPLYYVQPSLVQVPSRTILLHICLPNPVSPSRFQIIGCPFTKNVIFGTPVVYWISLLLFFFR